MTNPYQIEIADRQHTLHVDPRRIERVIRSVLRDAGLARAQISVAVVDDATIRRLNRRHLGHDDPTDVLSFPLECGEGTLEGEIVVSADTATAVAGDLGWSPAEELLLYVVHGALHLVGYDDVSAADRRTMRRREREVLAGFGLAVPWQNGGPADAAAGGNPADPSDGRQIG